MHTGTRNKVITAALRLAASGLTESYAHSYEELELREEALDEAVKEHASAVYPRDGQRRESPAKGKGEEGKTCVEEYCADLATWVVVAVY